MSLFSKYVPFKIELEKYIGHCRTVFDQIGDKSSSALVSGFIKDLDSQRYNITIIGSLKRGKSTLLNTLMERENDNISPISSNVCTSAIIKYIDAGMSDIDPKKEKAVIYFNDLSTPAATIPLAQLKDYVTEERNPGNRKQVRFVEVYGNFPEWSKAVTIIDSPGQNSVFDHHDILLSDFLPYTDAIIFLVAADIPLDGGDIALLKELSEDEKKKIFFVLTKIDNIDNPEDLDDVKDFVVSKIQSIGLPCDKLYTVAAKPVYEALRKGVKGNELNALKAEYGILELEEDLENFIIAESDQTKILRNRIEMLLDKTKESCDHYIVRSEAILSKKSYDLTVLQTEQEELEAANKLLLENTKKALKKFNRDWEKALTGFKRKFAMKSDMIEDKIIDGLNRGGLFGAVFQSFKLQKQVQKAVGIELQPLVLDLEERLEEVIASLNDEFSEELSLYVKRKSETDIGAVISSGAAIAGLAGTITWGVSATNGAIGSAMSAFSIWQKALADATMAQAANSTAAVGALAKFWGWLWGTGKATETATAAAKATAGAANAASSAIAAGISAVVTAGVSIAVTLLVQKILHIGLVKFQETRVLGITESVMTKMEDSLFNSLNLYKDALIKEYQQKIDDILEENNDRLSEIQDVLVNDDSEERQLITSRLEEVKGLLSEGVHIRKQIPTF